MYGNDKHSAMLLKQAKGSCAKVREYKHIEITNNTELSEERALADPSRSVVKFSKLKLDSQSDWKEVFSEIRLFLVCFYTYVKTNPKNGCRNPNMDFKTQRGLCENLDTSALMRSGIACHSSIMIQHNMWIPPSWAMKAW